MRKIDEKAMPFLKEKGYGKGTNYTTDLVASLMVQFAEKQGQELPIHNVSKCVNCDGSDIEMGWCNDCDDFYDRPF